MKFLLDQAPVFARQGWILARSHIIVSRALTLNNQIRGRIAASMNIDSEGQQSLLYETLIACRMKVLCACRLLHMCTTFYKEMYGKSFGSKLMIVRAEIGTEFSVRAKT